MYQIIKDRIEVVGVYREAQFYPRKFKWRENIYQIRKITFVANVRDGAVKKRRYSVWAGGNSYRLLFDRFEETWQLEEVWCD